MIYGSARNSNLFLEQENFSHFNYNIKSIVNIGYIDNLLNDDAYMDLILIYF